MVKDSVITMRREATDVLEGNILAFWRNRMTDTAQGGFYGRMTGRDVLMPDAEKGAVLNARILWTFSAAYRVSGRKEWLDTATRAKRYLIDYFYDREQGGVYWSLDCQGRPLSDKKQIYALGFAIYGLSEYARATGDDEALQVAIRLYDDIERHSLDRLKNGYLEALTRDWHELTDVRLSAKDANERKTMNTHLHILEPYTNLYRVWPDERLRASLVNLVELFLDRIWDAQSGHLRLFFDDDWQSKCAMVSYGHDIEASWLLHESALVLGDADLLKRVEPCVKRLAEAAAEGLNAEGGMKYEAFPDGRVDADCHWWVQAETVVGYLNLYQLTGDEQALEKSLRCWEFIKRHLIDYEHGEWYWSLRADGTVNRDDDKAGLWKCPYHNGRMCMEVMERLG